MCQFSLWVKIVKWVCVWGWNLKALRNRVLVSCLRVYCECVWVMYKQILSLFFLSALLSYSMFGWKWIQKLNFEYLTVRKWNKGGEESLCSVWFGLWMLNNEILAVFAALFFASILFLRFFVGFLSFGCFCCVLGEFF